jgi:hypothetical protein
MKALEEPFDEVEQVVKCFGVYDRLTNLSAYHKDEVYD